MSTVQLMTQAEYAKHRGCSAVAVHKAIKAGRISLIGEKVDPKVADIQWQQNTRARARTAPAPAVGEQQLPLATAEHAAPAAEPPIQRDSDYQAARTRREKAEAESAEMKLLEQKGVLVNIEHVRGELAKRVAAVRDGMLQIPGRLAPLLIGEPDQAKIKQLIDAEIRQALEHFAGDGSGAV